MESLKLDGVMRYFYLFNSKIFEIGDWPIEQGYDVMCNEIYKIIRRVVKRILG